MPLLCERKGAEVEVEGAGLVWAPRVLTQGLMFIPGAVQRCGRLVELIKISRITDLLSNNMDPLDTAVTMAATLRRGTKDRVALRLAVGMGATVEARTTLPHTLSTTRISIANRRPRRLPSSNDLSPTTH